MISFLTQRLWRVYILPYVTSSNKFFFSFVLIISWLQCHDGFEKKMKCVWIYWFLKNGNVIKTLRTWIKKNVISSIKTYSISHFLAHLTRFIITWVLFWSLSVISQVNLFLIFSRFLKTFTGFNDVHPVILLNRMCVNLDPIKTTYRLHDGFSALHMYIKRERRSR